MPYNESFRWGILGPGSIAKQFARGLLHSPQAQLFGVAGRSQSNVQAFAAEFNVPRAFASHEELLASSEIDAVYIATPHPFHLSLVEKACAAKKAVLCEKPMTPNFAGTSRAISAAKQQGTFLMEALWTRFVPAVAQALSWVKEGKIGEPRLVEASFGFRMGWHPESRLLAPELAGGSILDVGVYTIALCQWVFEKEPTAVKALGHVGETGVDEQAAILLRYSGGELGVLNSAVRTNTRHVATIYGTEGRVSIGEPFWKSTQVTLSAGGKEETLTLPFRGNGYEYEADEVQRCVRAGLLASPLVPWDQSLAIAKIMDAARLELGVRYPFEEN
ncbi:MAG: Gfo/Idh/MocA family oxidoreductase [Polyangiaceae bacterium]|nr:Gfo/Idh/MocA family oxidoreductase [Polyangiaceae bacterium]